MLRRNFLTKASFYLFIFPILSVPLSLAAFFYPASIAVFSTLELVFFRSSNVYFLHDSWSCWDQIFVASVCDLRKRGRRDWQDQASFYHKHLRHKSVLLIQMAIGRNLTPVLIVSVWHLTVHFVRLSWIPVMTFYLHNVPAGLSRCVSSKMLLSIGLIGITVICNVSGLKLIGSSWENLPLCFHKLHLLQGCPKIYVTNQFQKGTF